MDQHVATLIEELNFAANEIALVSPHKRLNLLLRSADCMEAFDRRLRQAGRPAFASGAIIEEWRKMAREVAYLTDSRLADALKGAALVLEATQVILDNQYEVVLERLGPEGWAN